MVSMRLQINKFPPIEKRALINISSFVVQINLRIVEVFERECVPNVGFPDVFSRADASFRSQRSKFWLKNDSSVSLIRFKDENNSQLKSGFSFYRLCKKA